jgi:DNA phosphorothioation-associated putative methyltransferase
MQAFCETVFQLGRLPRANEFAQTDAIRRCCGSLPKALNAIVDRHGEAAIASAKAARIEDLMVYLASNQLRRRIPFTKLSPHLQSDIRSFFGTYEQAEEQARHLLFASGDPQVLIEAIEDLPFGWWDAEESQFTIHRSCFNELPAVLRVYVACAARLFGDPDEADLIKFHPFSRKLTFQTYDDFDADPLPRLRLRIKVDLRRLFVTVFNHAEGPDRQLLYFKERFLPPEHPLRAKAGTFSKRLRKLGITEANVGYGPSEHSFLQLAEANGLTRGLHRKKTR